MRSKHDVWGISEVISAAIVSFAKMRQMLIDNFTIERLVISNTSMTEAGFTAVVAVLREGNNTVRELSVGSQLLRSREVIVHSVYINGLSPVVTRCRFCHRKQKNKDIFCAPMDADFILMYFSTRIADFSFFSSYHDSTSGT